MGEEKILSKHEKFLFNMHDFTDDSINPKIDDTPPPVFNEEELGAAKKESFDEGQREGVRKTLLSREQAITQLLEKISQSASALFAAESERENTYEQESIKLALSIFKKLFPTYSEKYALEELKTSILEILQTQKEQTHIIIEVAPDNVEPIVAHTQTIDTLGHNKERLTVQGKENLGTGDCRLTWSDGGAIRNTEDISNKIATLVEEALAADDRSVHDESIVKDEILQDDKNAASSEEEISVEETQNE